MSIIGTVQLSGRIKYVPPVPSLDSSMNPSWFADVLEQLPCSARKEEEYTLIADGDTVVPFSSLTSASVIIIKVMPNVGISPSPGFPIGMPAMPNPITVKLTSAVGIAQALAIDGFMMLLSQGVPYTALTIARAIGVQTVVRVQLFQFGS
jgi:hypothetical protein